MKTKIYGLWAGLSLCTAVGAFAVPITFQVDMSNQPAFNPATNTVALRGVFNSWNEYGLTNVPGTSIYTNTYNVTNVAGTWLQYKFFVGYSVPLNWEVLGAWHPGGNRAFQVPGTAQTLPVAYFSDAGPGGTSVAVTFQIDMTSQVGAGYFVPGNGDLIQAMGAFNNAWNAVVLTNDPAASNPNLYSGTYEETARPPGTYIEFKFANNVGGLGTLSYESLVGYPDNNRAFILSPLAQTLPVVFFSDTSGYPIKAGVYFQLDMSSQILSMNFNPATDQTWVRGDAMGWGNPPGGFQLFEDAGRPGIYTNLYTVNNQLTGAPFQFKNTIWHPANSSVVWEDGDNKSVTFVGNEPVNAAGYHVITVGPALFNGFQANTNDYLPADTWVTFTVSMTNAMGVTNNNPTYGGIDWGDGSGHAVYINGAFVMTNSWWAWKGTVVSPDPDIKWQLTNNPIGSQLYSVQVLLPKGTPVRVDYKYSIDGYDNEAAAFQDHFRDVRSLGFGNYVMPLDTFGTNYAEPDFGNLSIGAVSGGGVPVTWLGRPGVHLQTKGDLSGGGWTDLFQTDGTNWISGFNSADGFVSRTNYTVGAGQMFFRLAKPMP